MDKLVELQIIEKGIAERILDFNKEIAAALDSDDLEGLKLNYKENLKTLKTYFEQIEMHFKN